jgi:hypothetical protein
VLAFALLAFDANIEPLPMIFLYPVWKVVRSPPHFSLVIADVDGGMHKMAVLSFSLS